MWYAVVWKHGLLYVMYILNTWTERLDYHIPDLMAPLLYTVCISQALPMYNTKRHGPNIHCSA